MELDSVLTSPPSVEKTQGKMILRITCVTTVTATKERRPEEEKLEGVNAINLSGDLTSSYFKHFNIALTQKKSKCQTKVKKEYF